MSSTSAKPALNSIADFRQALESLPSSNRLTHTETEALYSIAYNLVEQGKIELANNYLRVITFYAPTNTKYVSGLALTYRLMNNLEVARRLYILAAAFEPHVPESLAALSEVLMLEGDLDLARATLGRVVDLCEQQSHQDSLGNHARVMLDLMRAHEAPSPHVG